MILNKNNFSVTLFKIIIFFTCIIILYENIEANCDLTLAGFININTGIGRIPYTLMDSLNKDLSMNFLQTRPSDFRDSENFSNNIVSLVKENFGTINPGKIILLTDALTQPTFNLESFKFLPKKSENYIKIALSMFETSAIPESWVNVLNENFDAVLVPDKFLQDVYEKCGVDIPIFVIPLPICADDFFKVTKNKKDKKSPIVFGCSASFDQRKNHKILVQAFIEEFKDIKNVKLKIHGMQYNNNKIFYELKKNIEIQNINNVEIDSKRLSWQDYVKFVTSLDCYVSLSKGEGFSIPPREALAAGIPCIISNNTAQKTICDSEFVKIVNSNILEPAYYLDLFGNEQLGCFFDCEIYEVRKALRDVYTNYLKYFNLAQNGQKWVKDNLSMVKTKYLNLFKPAKIIKGKKNTISENLLMINSDELYQKYLKLFF